MKERPILFNAEMVRAVLGGRKTQTRRVVKPQPPHWRWADRKWDDSCANVAMSASREYWVKCPYGLPGDRLWGRETFQWVDPMDWSGTIVECPSIDKWPLHPEDWTTGCREVGVAYRAEGEAEDQLLLPPDLGWRPSIHMPRWVSRINLEVTGVRVERVREISEDDAVDEGIPVMIEGHIWYCADGENTTREPIDAFETLWDSINAKHGFGWDSNPWVWVVEFEVAT